MRKATFDKRSWPIEALFDCLADIVFFIKDTEGRYLVVNDTLLKRCGLADKKQLIGKTPVEALGAQLGVSYEKQDQIVLRTGDPIVNQLELHVYPNRTVGWCLTNKRALHNSQGAVSGLVGVSQDLRSADRHHEEYQKLQSIIAYTEDNLADPPDIKTLSKIAGMSPFQLDRRMRQAFGLSTGQWVLKQRLDLARKELLETDAPIAEIALDAGYRDQSAFTRQFHRATGLTPSAFRRARES